MMLTKMTALENVLTDGPYFNGQQFALIDAAMAPFLMRLGILNSFKLVLSLSDYPKIAAWSDTLLSMDVVKRSVTSNLREIYIKVFAEKGGLLFADEA